MGILSFLFCWVCIKMELPFSYQIPSSVYKTYTFFNRQYSRLRNFIRAPIDGEDGFTCTDRILPIWSNQEISRLHLWLRHCKKQRDLQLLWREAWAVWTDRSKRDAPRATDEVSDARGRGRLSRGLQKLPWNDRHRQSTRCRSPPLLSHYL